jgi:hypothetical protein
VIYFSFTELEDNGNNNNNNNNGNYNYNNNNGNGNNAWYGSYYVGPYCSEKDGYSIHLGVFYDQGCSAHADNSVWADRNYGQELPFSSSPIVEDECLSCMQVDNDSK